MKRLGVLRRISDILELKRLEDRVRHHRLRFADEAKQILSQSSAQVLHALEATRILEHLGESESGIALVSAMPPAKTGVATFSMSLARENPGQLDYFTSFAGLEAYADSRVEVGAENLFFPIEMLSIAHRVRKYKSIIFSVGNSQHSEFVVRKILGNSLQYTNIRRYIHLHDPVLFNMCRLIYGSTLSLDAAFACSYPDFLGDFRQTPEFRLRELGISGFSALFADIDLAGAIVHSATAAEIIRQDVRARNIPIRTLFHPVFRSRDLGALVADPSTVTPTVGCFGVPGKDKYVEEVVRGCEMMFEKEMIGEVTFAGFGVSQVIRELVTDSKYPIRIVESPSDERLERLMRNCDIAIQLRRYDNGESSGVVPQLLEHGVRVICCPVGSFKSYGGLDGVIFLDGLVTPQKIVEATAEALSTKTDRKNIEEYISKHRSEYFIQSLKDLHSSQN